MFFLFAKIKIDLITKIMKMNIKDFIFMPAAHEHIITILSL